MTKLEKQIFDQYNEILNKQQELEKELKISSRDMVEKAKTKDTTILQRKALKFIQTFNVIYYDSIIWFKPQGGDGWERCYNPETLCSYILSWDSSLSKSATNNIAWYIQQFMKGALNIPLDIEKNYLCFDNGYIDLNDQELKIYEWENKDIFKTLPINHIRYSIFNENELGNTITPLNIKNAMYEFLNWCAKGDEKELKIIYKMLGVVMSNIKVEYFFNLFGEQGSGKSTLLQIAKQLIGSEYCVDVPMKQLNERFGLEPLIGKKLLYNGDASNSEFDPAMLKKLTTTTEDFYIECKNQGTRLQTNLNLNVIICSNHFLNVKDMDGVERRHIPIHFPYNSRFVSNDNSFRFMSNEEMNCLLDYTNGYTTFKKEAIECILWDVVLALKELANNHYKFYVDTNLDNCELSQYGIEAKESTTRANDNILQWLDDYPILDNMREGKDGWIVRSKFYFINTNTLYQNYASIIVSNNGKPKNKNNFVDSITKYFNKLGYVIKTKSSIRDDITDKIIKGNIQVYKQPSDLRNEINIIVNQYK